MRSNIFKEAKISLLVFSVVIFLCIMFCLFASMFTSMGYEGFHKNSKTATAYEENITVVIDPGHGGEDPGAVCNGLIEKDLNLDISLKIAEFLDSFGYNVVLTRSEDILLYNENESASKKQQDLSNRVRITNNSNADCFVSVHMNKFPAEYCKGLQVFFSDNNEQSKELAESVQQNSQLLQKDNRREIKNGTDTIYVLENLDIPSILIECGFLSNNQEAENLSADDYRSMLAFTIYCGISSYLEI